MPEGDFNTLKGMIKGSDEQEILEEIYQLCHGEFSKKVTRRRPQITQKEIDSYKQKYH